MFRKGWFMAHSQGIAELERGLSEVYSVSKRIKHHAVAVYDVAVQ